MNQRFIIIGGTLVLLGAMLPVTAGERKHTDTAAMKKTAVPPAAVASVHSAKYAANRQWNGNLTFWTQAVDLRLAPKSRDHECAPADRSDAGRDHRSARGSVAADHNDRLV